MHKNQKPNEVNDPWYIPAVPTGKSDFGPPNCPVRALRYYHRYSTEHPELMRKGRRHLFVIFSPSSIEWAIAVSGKISGKILCLYITQFCVACHSATVGETDTKPVLYNKQHL